MNKKFRVMQYMGNPPDRMPKFCVEESYIKEILPMSYLEPTIKVNCWRKVYDAYSMSEAVSRIDYLNDLDAYESSCNWKEVA